MPSSPHASIEVRRAEPADLPELGRLGAELMRTHHAFDGRRFMAPGENPEGGYAWFLGTELNRDDVVVLVAEDRGRIAGYVYAGIEPQSWRELRDEAGFIHDIVVDERYRGQGIARVLLTEAINWLESRGVARVMLWTAVQNSGAQRLFERMGFRQTMIEMTREAGG